MAQGTRAKIYSDKYIESKMTELSNIKKMYDTTSGETRTMWERKWYDLVKVIAVEIECVKNKAPRT